MTFVESGSRSKSSSSASLRSQFRHCFTDSILLSVRYTKTFDGKEEYYLTMDRVIIPFIVVCNVAAAYFSSLSYGMAAGLIESQTDKAQNSALLGLIGAYFSAVLVSCSCAKGDRTCVPQSAVCNGVVDCHDGADEATYNVWTTIESDNIFRLTRVFADCRTAALQNGTSLFAVSMEASPTLF